MKAMGYTALILIFSCFFANPVSGADSLPDLFERVNPAVVDIQGISVEQVATSLNESTSVTMGNDGSGVLVESDGTILTASHVIQTAEKVVVKLMDGREFNAKIVASVNWGDIALLKLENPPTDLPAPVALANSDNVRIGEQVFVVGAPFGYSHSLSVGHISSRFNTDAMVGTGSVEVFQTDASMNPGNSGGPLFNMDGEVIGIASHIRSTSGGFNGLAFAVTSNQILKILEKNRSWSGIDGRVISGGLAQLLNLPQKAGLLVEKVAKNSWGGRIGLIPSAIAVQINGEDIYLGGDIILQIGEIVVDTDPGFFENLTEYLYQEKQAGRKAKYKILRGGNIIYLQSAEEPRDIN